MRHPHGWHGERSHPVVALPVGELTAKFSSCDIKPIDRDGESVTDLFFSKTECLNAMHVLHYVHSVPSKVHFVQITVLLYYGTFDVHITGFSTIHSVTQQVTEGIPSTQAMAA